MTVRHKYVFVKFFVTLDKSEILEILGTAYVKKSADDGRSNVLKLMERSKIWRRYETAEYMGYCRRSEFRQEKFMRRWFR